MGKEIRADIIVGGHADASLTQLGDSIGQLGEQINQISRALIDFGKESVNSYADYDDAMRDAQAALQTKYTNLSDLAAVMAELDRNALQWASDSKFTTLDVAGAIAEAAHAGWDLDQILAGMPAAMQIAQAGGMDLSAALQYLVDIANGAGLDFDNLAGFVDIWAYSANNASTNVNEMGEAMQKMGATMQFVDGDMAALATMLAVLANNGTKGSDAGTLLRNAMIRLIVPTKKAADAMAGLNLSAEETAELSEDAEAIEAAGAALEAAGFSAYDAEGKMKPVLQIWEELAEATAGMSEEQRNSVLSAIFPTRTMAGALALLNSASEGWGGLYKQLNLASQGYAEWAGLVMEGGVGGSMRHLQSVWNAMQTRTGNALSDEVTTVSDALAGLLENIMNMDDASFNGLVGGLEAIAVAGPALIGTAAGIKLMAMLFGTGPGGWIAMGAIGIAALAAGLYSYISTVEEMDSAELFEKQFGSLTYDETMLGQFLAGMQTGYTQAAEGIERYNDAVDAAFRDYKDYSGQMKQSLLTQLVTNAKLTDEDEATLQALGQKIQESIITGLKSSQSADEAMIAMLQGDGAGAEADNPMWAAIMETMESGYDAAIAQATSLGEGLRAAITEAFADGGLTQEEIDNIQAILNDFNDIQASIVNANNAAAEARIIAKTQGIGIEGLKSAAQMVYSARDDELESMWNLFYGDLENGGTYARAQWTGSTPEQLAFLESEFQASRAETSARYDQMLARTFTAALNESDFGEAWKMMAEYAADGIVTDQEYERYRSGNSQKQRNYVNDAVDMMMEAFGGTEKIQQLAGYFAGQGNTEMATFYRSILGMYAMGNAAGYNDSSSVYSWLEDLGLPHASGTGTGIWKSGASKIRVDADTTMAENKIAGIDGRTVTVNVDAAVSGSAKSSGGGWMSNLFAEGGRAEEASIFGEAGPEWAIPEEHSQRTAELLSAAAKASGFTWPELLARNGGLNSGGGAPWTLVYSPTINASGGGDLESVLRADKDRLSRWLMEQRLHDEIEVYA